LQVTAAGVRIPLAELAKPAENWLRVKVSNLRLGPTLVVHSHRELMVEWKTIGADLCVPLAVVAVADRTEKVGTEMKSTTLHQSTILIPNLALGHRAVGLPEQNMAGESKDLFGCHKLFEHLRVFAPIIISLWNCVFCVILAHRSCWLRQT